jgi:hypothetical protein
MFGALRRIALRIFRPGMMSIPLALSNFAMDLLEVAPAM